MLELQSVTKKFASYTAVNNISLTIQPGEIVGLLGENGAGKSTLFSLISGVNSPTSGTVRLNGQDPRRVETRRSIGVTPQGTGLDQRMQVRTFLEFVAAHFHTEELLPTLMEEFHLTELATKIIGTLSGGQQRLVAVAGAFLANAPLTLLDEPTTGLDTSIRSAIWDAIRSRTMDGILMITSHYIEEIEHLCDRVLVMKKGTLIADASVQELTKAQSGSIITLTNVHPQAMQRINDDCSVLGREGGGVLIETHNPTRELAILAEENWPFEDITITRPTLEQAFLRLTQ